MKTMMKRWLAPRRASNVVPPASVRSFPPRRGLALLALFSALALATAGCGRERSGHANAGKPTTAAEVAARLQTAFKSADPLIKKEADGAVADIQRHDYAAAINALEKMRAEPLAINFRQDTVVRNAVEFLQSSSSGKAQNQSLPR